MLTVPLSELGKDDVAIAGGKGASLGELMRAGIPVPPGFVVVTGAFERFLSCAGIRTRIEEQLALAQRGPGAIPQASSRIQGLIAQADIPAELRDEIMHSFDALGARFVAVRSSATAEDGAQAAWAGQLETFLDTPKELLLARVRECWASLFSPRALAYRAGQRAQRISVAVVVQAMLESEAAGVAFSAHPVTEDRDRILIEAALGLGESVVSGQVTPDSYVVSKRDLRIVERSVAMQERGLFRSLSGGSEWRVVPGDGQKVPDERIVELARLVARIERHYGFPVDVEWAAAGGRISILQSRPITTLRGEPRKDRGEESRDEDAVEYEIVERLYNAPWLLVGYSSVGFVHDFPRLIGVSPITCYVGTMDGAAPGRIVNEMLFVPEEFEEAARANARRMVEDDAWRTQRESEFEDAARSYFAECEKMRTAPLRELSAESLAQIARRVTGFQRDVRLLGVVLNGVIVDGRNHLSTMIREALHAEIGDEDFDERWSLLTQVTCRLSMRQEKVRALLALKRAGGDAGEGLRALHERYCWLEYMYLGPAGTLAQLREEFEAVREEDDPERTVAAARDAQEALLARIRASARARALVGLAQGVLWQKGWRKDVEYHGCWCYEALLRELASRAREPDWRTLAFLLPWELEGFILGEGPSLAQLRARMRRSCIVVDKSGHRMLSGEDAGAFLAALPIAHAHASQGEVHGQCAYAGKARGRVRIIHVPAEMAKMEQGDILVSQATSPDLLEAMRKAGAIVTNTGGLICHAAITARELRIPCVVGTRRATLEFQDGDIVEVDAGKGVARKVS